MLAVGADAQLPPGFEVPFRMTADYLGMNWRGWCYVEADGPAPDPAFAERIAATLR